MLVATVLALGWGAWNLIVRPYPSDYCGSPISALTDDDVEAETETRRQRFGADRNGDGVVTDAEREFFAESLPPLFPSEEREIARLVALCPNPATAPGFWFRGLAPLVVVLGGVVVVRYIATGSIRERSPQDPEREDVVR